MGMHNKRCVIVISLFCDLIQSKGRVMCSWKCVMVVLLLTFTTEGSWKRIAEKHPFSTQIAYKGEDTVLLVSANYSTLFTKLYTKGNFIKSDSVYCGYLTGLGQASINENNTIVPVYDSYSQGQSNTKWDVTYLMSSIDGNWEKSVSQGEEYPYSVYAPYKDFGFYFSETGYRLNSSGEWERDNSLPVGTDYSFLDTLYGVVINGSSLCEYRNGEFTDPIEFTGNGDIQNVEVVDSGLAFLLSESSLYKFSDGKFELSHSFDSSIVITSMEFFDTANGLVVGYRRTSGSTCYPVMMRCRKGVWHKQLFPGSSGPGKLNNICFADSSEGYVIGENAMYYYSSEDSPTSIISDNEASYNRETHSLVIYSNSLTVTASESGMYGITIYNLRGQKKKIVDSFLSIGKHSWNLENYGMGKGVYMVKIDCGNQSSIHRCVLK